MAAAAHSAQLQKIEHKTITAGSEEVVLSFNTVVEPKVFSMGGKQPRLVFDFDGVEPYRTLRDLSPEGALVKRVRLGVHRQGDVKTRLVFDVSSLQGLKHSYSVDESNKRLVIRFAGAGTAVAAKEKPAQTAPARLQADAAKKKSAGQETAARRGSGPEKETEKAVMPAPVRKDAVAVPKPAPVVSPSPAVAGKVPAGQQAAKPVEQVAPNATQAVETASSDPPAAPPAPTPAPTPAPAESAPVAGTSGTIAATPPTAGPAVSTETPYLSAIQFDPDSPRGELVQFKLNGFYPPVLRSIETGSPQVICEFSNLQIAPALEGPIKISGRFVKAIRLDKAADGSKVRVFVELEPNQSYDLQQVFFKEDNFFVLIVNTVKA